MHYGVLEEEERKKKGRIFEEIMAKNFPDLDIQEYINLDQLRFKNLNKL